MSLPALRWIPAACVFLVPPASHDEWQPLAQSGDQVVLSSRLQSGEKKEDAEGWLLFLRNETQESLSITVRWQLSGQSHIESRTLGPDRIQEFARTFPKGDGKTPPEVILITWEKVKEE